MDTKRPRGWGPRKRFDKRTGRYHYVVDYRDSGGKRHQPRYETLKDANESWRNIQLEMGQGRHVAPHQSVILDQAAENYYDSLRNNDAARGTIDMRRCAYKKYIHPSLGKVVVARLTGPMVHNFLSTLRKQGVSENRVAQIKATLSAILSEAILLGHAAFNAATAARARKTRRAAIMKITKRRCKVLEKSVVKNLIETAGNTGAFVMAIRHDGRLAKMSDRQQKRLHIDASMEAVEIVRVHDGDEKYALAELEERWSTTLNVVIRCCHIASWTQPFLAMMAFIGLRIGEMRGLDWQDIEWAGAVTVRQAVDGYNTLAPVKSPAALRSVPVGDSALALLRRWWLKCGCPKSGLVFPSPAGKQQWWESISGDQYVPLWLMMNLRRDSGELMHETFHSLRHFCVSLWIDQGANPKEVQTWIGHSLIQTTMDIYGHLFEDYEAARKKVSQAEHSVLGLPSTASA